MIYNRENLQKGSTILIRKPMNWTSFQVVNKMRWLIKNLLNIQKIKVGHAGTLDPLAEGLLIICTGKSTKKIEEFQNLKKTYTGVFYLGATRPSFDLETDIDTTSPIDHLKKDDLIKVRDQFVGDILQTPPLFSAVKFRGKKLYEYARAGEKIEPRKRKVSVYNFKLSKIKLPKVYFEIECSKGTYIRSIANDYGQKLGVGAYLESLVRTQIGNYCLKQAISIEEFEKKIEAKPKV